MEHQKRDRPTPSGTGSDTEREALWYGPDPGLSHLCPPPRNGVKVNGVRVDPCSPEALVDTIDSFLGCGRAHVVNFLAVDPIARSQGDAAYRALLNRAELNLADGLPVAWGARLLGQSTLRMPGTDCFRLVAMWGLSRSLGHFLFGGGTDRDLERLENQLRLDLPSIRIAGSQSPPFRELSGAELDEAAERIRSSGTHALWIGLGTPKQHVVGQELRARDAAPLIFCVGAAFDFISGAKRRAPDWMQRSGLEWAHRLGSEPNRLWKRYLVGNPRFVAGYVRRLIIGTGRSDEAPR